MDEEQRKTLRSRFASHHGIERLYYLPIIKNLELYSLGRAVEDIEANHPLADISVRLTHMLHAGLLESRTTFGVTYLNLTDAGHAYGKNEQPPEQAALTNTAFKPSP